MKFMNLSKWLYQNPHEKAGEEDNLGGGGGSQEEQPIQVTQSQLNQLIDNAVSQRLKANDEDENKGPSIIDKRKQREEGEKREQQIAHDNQMYALRSLQFDQLLSDNKEILGDSLNGIRKDVEDTVGTKDLSKVTPLLYATAAKEYFSDENNLNVLGASDKQFVQDEILGKRFEHQIDGMKAAEYLERAIHIQKQRSDDKTRRGSNGLTGAGEFSGTPNLKARLDRFFPERVSEIEGAN